MREKRRWILSVSEAEGGAKRAGCGLKKVKEDEEEKLTAEFHCREVSRVVSASGSSWDEMALAG
jgi:hypothetical protein